MHADDLTRVHRELITELLIENARLRADATRAHAHCADLMHAQAAHADVCETAQAIRLAKFAAAFAARPHGRPETTPSSLVTA